MPTGRPVTYDPDIAAEICRRLGEGEGLRAICRSEGMPPESTVRTWVADDRDGFAVRYTTARQAQALRWAEEILEIADDGSNDWIERNTADGGRGYEFHGEHYQRSRLRVDTRKWLLSKVLPKVYGDKIEVTGKDGKDLVPEAQPIERTALAILAVLEAAKREKE